MFTRLIITIVLLYINSLVIDADNKKLLFEKVSTELNAPNTPIYGITKDSVGYMWFGSWNGLYRYDGTQFVVYRNDPTNKKSIPSNRIRNIFINNDGKLWVLTFDNRYAVYSYQTNDFTEYPLDSVHEDIVFSLSRTANAMNKNAMVNHCQWFIRSRRLMQQNRETQEILQYESNVLDPSALTDDYVTWYYLDDQQILWVGTRSGAINKANWNRKSFHVNYCRVMEDNKLKNRSVRALCLNDNALWLGTNYNGILISDNNQNLTPFPTLTKRIRALYKDRNGYIWVGGRDGLDRIDPKNKQEKHFFGVDLQPNFLVYSIFAITEDSEENIWFGTYNGIAKISARSQEVIFYDLATIIKDHSVMELLFDQSGNLWLGTEGSGVIELKKGDSSNLWSDTIIYQSNHLEQQSISGNLIYSLYEDSKHQMWVGTSKGLNRINPKTQKVDQYTTKQGLPDDYISAVIGDENDDIWISHKRGISKLDNLTNTITNFSAIDGKAEWAFLDGASLKDKQSGMLYFGAREGYISFIPSEITHSPIPPKVVLTSLKILGKSIKPKEELSGSVILDKALSLTKELLLRFQDRSFEISFAALHYANPDKNIFSYKLDGYDDHYLFTNATNPVATYSKVPAGEYTLRVKAANPDGIWSEETLLAITILSPWYATSWAYLIYIILVLSALMAILYILTLRIRLKTDVEIERLRAEKQHEVDNMKIEFYTNISHEIRTPLSLILDPLEQLQQGAVSTQMLPEYVSLMRRNANKLMLLINQLLDFRKADSGKMVLNVDANSWVQFVSNSVELFKLKSIKRNITLDFIAEEDEIRGVFDSDMMEKVMGNLISNAFKYTQDKGHITVKLSTNTDNKSVIIEVADTGKGIAPELLTSIFDPFNSDSSTPFEGVSSGIGLALTKKMIELHGGTISVESTINQGTKFIVIIPIWQKMVDNELLDAKSINKTTSLDANKSTNILTDELPILLLIDDNKDIRFYLKSELKDSYQIFEEADGLSGFNRAVDLIPDMIISDVMMPGLNGMELCQKLKTDQRTSHIPVILLTAKNSQDNRIEGLETGADSYITKPFSIALLRAQINSIQDNRERFKQRFNNLLVDPIKDDQAPLLSNSVDTQFMDKMMELIDKNMSKSGYNSEDLALELNISQRQLYRKLKALTGQTVHEVITNRRLEIACSLLLNDGLNISETAYNVGYTEPSNFSRTFSKRYGCSPSKYISDHNK